jgi:hypothetical protein
MKTIKTILFAALAFVSASTAASTAAFAGNDSTPPTIVQGLYVTASHYCAIRIYSSNNGQNITTIAERNPLTGLACDDGGEAINFVWGNVTKTDGTSTWAYERRCQNDQSHWCQIIEFINERTIVNSTSNEAIGYYNY